MLDNSVINGSKIVIENYGCSNFLKPPTHPDTSRSIKVDGMLFSISSAMLHTNVAVRIIARKIMEGWQIPPINMDWVYRVLGYYRHAWRNPRIGDPECWFHSNVLYCEDPVGASYLDHFGVHWIQKFYPDYFPTEKDFKNAYWSGETAFSQSAKLPTKSMNYTEFGKPAVDNTAIIPYTGTCGYDPCSRIPASLNRLYSGAD